MKTLALAFFITLVASNFSAFAAPSLEIKKQDYRCRDGRISTDIEVVVDGEKFSLSPSCRFSFSETLKTKAGTECEVRAGMCSAFSPKNRFDVKCKGGAEKSVPIDCP